MELSSNQEMRSKANPRSLVFTIGFSAGVVKITMASGTYAAHICHPNPREETMKMRLLVTVAEFAIGFVLPVLAQEQNMVDPEVRQQIEAVLKMREEAINKNDAAAVAALYTQDAASIRSWESEGGLASGQQAIEKRYATELASSPGKFVDKLARVCPAGNQMCAISEGSWGLWKGYYVRIYVWDADSWKIRVEYVIFGRH
jgi:ketosteroid isomerase-like protein